jgi:thymidine phosphorylase
MSTIKARESGYVKSIDALELGIISCSLGAGRSKAGEAISPEVGFKLLKKVTAFNDFYFKFKINLNIFLCENR